ncbi:hypothetical protein O181_009216 [Austropuccinia psidii MF-1]|uniref:Uncharacterized protein n=1 Tax=Austropuccinia psidii MF-1 TaxID=1389203 RepID=A0A9Q3BNX3_9BASI|nr:hypothetical protein [Austropuccinia psidii MF-1]
MLVGSLTPQTEPANHPSRLAAALEESTSQPCLYCTSRASSRPTTERRQPSVYFTFHALARRDQQVGAPERHEVFKRYPYGKTWRALHTSRNESRNNCCGDNWKKIEYNGDRQPHRPSTTNRRMPRYDGKNSKALVSSMRLDVSRQEKRKEETSRASKNVERPIKKAWPSSAGADDPTKRSSPRALQRLSPDLQVYAREPAS